MIDPVGNADLPHRGSGDGGAVASGPPRQGGSEAVGRYLSRQRRLRGISLEELSNLTKIPVRSLERLEGGLFDGDNDGFVRGFVRTVADALGLDPEDAVARTLSEVRVDEPAISMTVFGRRAVAVLALVLVLAGLVAAGRALVGGLLSPGPGVQAGPETVPRRDPVRSLAEAARALDAIPPAPEATPDPAGDEDSPAVLAGDPR